MVPPVNPKPVATLVTVPPLLLVPVQPLPASLRSAQARRATVNAPPLLVCFTTCDVPPVLLKSVVPAGKVSVLVPAVAAALRVSVPDVAPFNCSFPSLNWCTPVQVGAIDWSNAGAPSLRKNVPAEPFTALSPTEAEGVAPDTVVPPCATHVLLLSHRYHRSPLVASVSIYTSPTLHVAGSVVLCGTRSGRVLNSHSPGEGCVRICGRAGGPPASSPSASASGG